MSRPLRIDYPNAWHHVMNRARRGTDLFVNKADYQQFIDLLQETAELFNVNVAAYLSDANALPSDGPNPGCEPVTVHETPQRCLYPKIQCFSKRKSIRKFQRQRGLHPIWIGSYLK